MDDDLLQHQPLVRFSDDVNTTSFQGLPDEFFLYRRPLFYLPDMDTDVDNGNVDGGEGPAATISDDMNHIDDLLRACDLQRPADDDEWVEYSASSVDEGKEDEHKDGEGDPGQELRFLGASVSFGVAGDDAKIELSVVGGMDRLTPEMILAFERLANCRIEFREAPPRSLNSGFGHSYNLPERMGWKGFARR